MLKYRVESDVVGSKKILKYSLTVGSKTKISFFFPTQIDRIRAVGVLIDQTRQTTLHIMSPAVDPYGRSLKNFSHHNIIPFYVIVIFKTLKGGGIKEDLAELRQ